MVLIRSSDFNATLSPNEADCDGDFNWTFQLYLSFYQVFFVRLPFFPCIINYSMSLNLNFIYLNFPAFFEHTRADLRFKLNDIL